MLPLSDSSPLFLNWARPWLPQLADLLLEKTADFSETVIILPGRRAGRRLLELLALSAQKNAQLLIPPTIMTLEEAIFALLEIPNDIPIAGKSISRLAWRQAALQLTPQELQAIQSSPQGVSIKKDAVPRIASLGESLALELGRGGLSIEETLLQHTPFFPESAEREEPRWQALARLQKKYQNILSQWGYEDPLVSLQRKLDQGKYLENKKVLVAGLADFPNSFIPFFEKVDPEMIIIAPKEHAEGFDRYGKIISSYWLKHPAEVPENILIACERSQDQAIQTWKVITHWKEVSPEVPITIVAPETESLSLLREAGASKGFQTRWAGGNRFQGSSLFLLLETLKKFLTRRAGEPPSLAAVSDLLRHPLVAKKLTASLMLSPELLLRELDEWEREHLSLFLEKDHLEKFQKEKSLGVLLKELESHFVFALEPEPLGKLLHQWRSLLLYLLEKETVRRTDPEGHFFLECFEKLIFFLEELEELAASTTFSWRSSELLSFLLEILHQESIPELEQPQAVEIVGWLEAIAEDTPSLILTSFHEGAIPSSLKTNPLLSESLRKKIGLDCSEEELARDHYYLQLIVAMREKEGGTAILVPRYNGRNEPVRPSRLILQGCSVTSLPSRILTLTQRQEPTHELAHATNSQDLHSLFSARPVDPLLIERLNVTALKTYLQSPRLFYLQHILKLREVLDPPLEMTPAQFGVLLHRILGAFSSEPSLQKETNPSVFCSWLEKALERSFQWQFGKNPLPAVLSQKEELLRALKGFAQAEAAHRTEGWKTIAVEGNNGSAPLLEHNIVIDGGRSLVLQGRIDRLDWHPEKERWLLLDYKTSHHQEWKKETPNRRHFQHRGDSIIWHDLQLPLYLKLATQLQAVLDSRFPLPTIENTDLCYFQLPIHPDAAGISEPFDHAMIEPAWEEAQRLIALILNGHFEEVGTLNTTLSPTWKALCGVK